MIAMALEAPSQHDSNHIPTSGLGHDTSADVPTVTRHVRASAMTSVDVASAQRKVEQKKTVLGPNDPATLSSMFDLGKAFHGDGLIEKALGVFQELLPLNEKRHGPDATNTIAALDAICEELCNMGKYEQCLIHLSDERERCERAMGPDNEQTIRVLIDIANVCKLLEETDDAATTFSLALERSMRGLGATHHVTMAIRNDIRGLALPPLPNLERMKALLRRNNLPVPTEPFPVSQAATWREVVAGKVLHIISSVSYEASNAMSLRMGPINGEERPQPPVHIPPRHPDPNTIELEPASTAGALDHSFKSLVDRSIEILPRGGTPATQKAVERHTAFLRGLNSLDELLMATETPFWFFQRRESFMEQTTFQKWDPNALGRYVVVPTDGAFANSEYCIFVSHYWRTQAHPDPDGEDLRQLQGLLNEGFWSKAVLFWVDWTCLPQWVRTRPQDNYFRRALASISRLVRDCSFVAQFPEYRPRLWVLFEVAAFTFNRAEPVGLPCTDIFERHLSQMQGDGVRHVLNEYGYRCTNKSDREWVITLLEVLLALRKVVPSIHTRRQILDVVDNAAVRSCIHVGVGVEIDKERGILKGPRETVFQFNPMAVQNGVDVRISSDHEVRLQRALERADQSFDNAGVGEMAREYDRAGDYNLGETLHRLALSKDEDDAGASYDLVANLESQEQYEAAAAQCRRHKARFNGPGDIHQKLAALEQKEIQLQTYRRWKSQPLENTLGIRIMGRPTTAVQQPAIRNGLRRSWLQRLDQRVWKSEDPLILKCRDELALQCEEKGQAPRLAQQMHLTLLRQRKASLGPCHADTRRSLCHFGRASLAAGDAGSAHIAYLVGLAVCDFTLGARHPESQAVLGQLAEAVLERGRPGLARGYYRQQLERTMAVAEWGDPRTFVPKFFLHALVGNARLEIVQGANGARVQIIGIGSMSERGPESEGNGDNVLAMADREAGLSRHSTVMILDMERADIVFNRYTIARKGRS
jgi:tetratricopeptide (TPR) repeat protein